MPSYFYFYYYRAGDIYYDDGCNERWWLLHYFYSTPGSLIFSRVLITLEAFFISAGARSHPSRKLPRPFLVLPFTQAHFMSKTARTHYRHSLPFFFLCWYILRADDYALPCIIDVYASHCPSSPPTHQKCTGQSIFVSTRTRRRRRTLLLGRHPYSSVALHYSARLCMLQPRNGIGIIMRFLYRNGRLLFSESYWRYIRTEVYRWWLLFIRCI